MDHDVAAIRKLEPDDLQQIACSIRSDGEHTRWIAVRIQIEHNDGMFDRMSDCDVRPSVLEGRSMKLHTS